MKHYKFLLAGTVIVTASAFFLIRPAGAADELDKIVAVVNDDVIMFSEFTENLRSIKKQLREQGTQLPPAGLLEKQVLDRLILKRLQTQMAQQTGIRVDDESLNRTISNIAAENQMTLNEFRQILEEDGYSYETFRDNIREEILISRLQQRQVDNRVTVSDREINNFLANKERQGDAEIEFRIAHILISTPENAPSDTLAATRELAEKVHSDLKDGADFSELAVSYSDGQQALNGGDLGWRQSGQMPTLFAGSVLNMQKGDISDIIKSPSGYHIIKLTDTRSSDKVVVTQTHARHILVRPNELTTEADALLRLEQLKLRLLGGDDFEELARAHSDDTVSAANGGDLGWTSPGDLVPAFENVMNKLQANEISDPFRSQFGFHIVQVLERREHDSTENIKRARARDSIRRRKLEEARGDWLREMRDDAYVEYRVDF
ncbi:MAG: peptidylprolyl isomerase [Gammaproteobacteria bacterium]